MLTSFLSAVALKQIVEGIRDPIQRYCTNSTAYG